MENIGDANMDNGYVRLSTCQAVHKSIDDKLDTLHTDMAEIYKAVNPKVLRHDDWINSQIEEDKRRIQLSWQIKLLITGAIALPYIKAILDYFMKRI